MDKPSSHEHDVHPLIRDRWSPRAYADRPVSEATLRSLFEAARWAPSAFNEPPWRFIVANKSNPERHAKLLSTLADANQTWAVKAPVLAISVASTTFSRNGKPNRHALHDVGLASAQLTLQATALDLSVHMMAGFDAAKAREVYGIPEGFEPVAAIAIGYAGEPAGLPEGLREREGAPRVRHPQDASVFAEAWGQAY